MQLPFPMARCGSRRPATTMLSRVDPATNKVVSTTSVGEGARASLTVGAGSVWTLNQGDGTISRVDTTSRQAGEQPSKRGFPARAARLLLARVQFGLRCSAFLLPGSTRPRIKLHSNGRERAETAFAQVWGRSGSPTCVLEWCGGWTRHCHSRQRSRSYIIRYFRYTVCAKTMSWERFVAANWRTGMKALVKSRAERGLWLEEVAEPGHRHQRRADSRALHRHLRHRRAHLRLGRLGAEDHSGADGHRA